jgi:hypothetical protein
LKRTTILDCSIIEIPKVSNRAGNISIIEGQHALSFIPKRVFYIYDIPSGESRGAHAHLECHQFIVAASGSFEVILDDGTNEKIEILNRPYIGLYVPPGIWAQEKNFSAGAICLVLTSHKFFETDYIRNYDQYLKYKQSY